MRDWVAFYLRWLEVGFKSIWGIVGVSCFFVSIIVAFVQDLFPRFTKSMTHLAWQIPLVVFFVLAFIGLVIAPYELHRQDQKKAADEKNDLSRRADEVTAQLETERKNAAQKRPRLYLKYEYPGAEVATFSGLTVGNYGEPAYDVRLTSRRNHGCGLDFFQGATTLGTDAANRVNLAGVFTAGAEQRFQATLGGQIPAMFERLAQFRVEEKVIVTLHCEDHDGKAFDEEWFISRDLHGQISCGRAPF